MPQGRDFLDEAADEVYAGQATAVDELDAAADEVYGDRRDLKFARPPKKKGVIRQAAEDIARGAKIEGREFVGSAMRITGGALQHGEKLAEKAGIAGTGVRQLGALGRTLEEKAPEVKGDSFLGAVAGSTLAMGVPALAAVATAPASAATLISGLTMGAFGVLATGYQEGRAAEARAKAVGASKDQADEAYWDAATSGWTITSGASEGLLGLILGKANALTGGRLKGVFGNLILGAGEEGATGYAQEFASLVNENTTAEEKRTIREILATEQARLLRAGLLEAAAVGPLSLVASAVNFKLQQPVSVEPNVEQSGGEETESGVQVRGTAEGGGEQLPGVSRGMDAGAPAAAQGLTGTGAAPGQRAGLRERVPAPGQAQAGAVQEVRGEGAEASPGLQETAGGGVAVSAAPPSDAQGIIGPEPVAPRSGPRPLISELKERYAGSEIAPLPEGSVEAESGEQAITRVAQELREVGEPEAARALEASQEKRPLTRADRARRAPPTRSELMQSLEEAADSARERIKGRGLRMYAGVDPAELKDELIVATNYVAKGVVKFADFAKEMVREFGEAIRPHLRKLFAKARGDAQSQFPETNPAFRKWFGESKAVDEEGFPRAVYHGSPDVRGLTQFQTLQERFLGEPDPERGFWFTADKRVAETYADDRRAFDYQGAEPGVVSVYLSIKNPLVIDAGGKSWRGTRDAIARARAGGHDGVIVRNVVDDYETTNQSRPTTTYAVLNPEQIKSTENRGTFDPEDPTLMHAGISTPEVGALLKRFTGMPTETDTGDLVPPVQTGAQRTRQEVQAAMEPFERAAASSGRKEFTQVAERATTYQDRAAYRWDKIREGQVTPILETVKEVGRDKAEAYLYARHAPDANRVTLERTEGANAAGSGMTNEQAAAIIRAAESGPHAGRFKALGRRWDALMQQNLEMAVGYKLITPETAKALQERYPHYVPLKTLMDEGERTAMGIGKGADIRGPEFKVRLGRNTVADAPLAHGLAALQRTLIRGEKRRMLQPLVDLLAAEGGEIPGFVKLRRSNLIEDLPRNVVGLGPDLRLEFEPEYQDFVDAIQNPTGRGLDQRTLLGAISRHVGKLTRTISGLATRYNPVFPIINAVFRDPGTAFIISNEHGLAFASRVVKDGPKAWLAMFGKGPWAKQAETYRANGGQMATLGVDDVQGHLEQIKLDLSEPGKVKRGMRSLIGMLSRYADAGENAMRLSAFVHAHEDLGMSLEEATAYAKNLTTNFRRKGLSGNYINAWWMFSNAGIQGTERAGRALGNPNVQKLVGAAVLMSGMLDWLNRVASDEDEDGVRFYDAIPEYQKRNNILLPYPGGRRFLAIPAPFVFNWFHALGTNIAEEAWDQWTGEDVSGSFVGDMAVAAMDSFNPLGGTDQPMTLLLPTILDPFAELATNEDFAGRQIARKPFPGQVIPPSEQYWPDVNPTVRAITEKLNEWTGGDKYEPGSASVNPEWLEHLGKFLTSGTGQTLGQVYDVADKSFRGEEVTAEQVPLIRRLVQDPSPFAVGGRYRDARDEVKLATKRTEGEPGPPTDKDRPLWALKGALSSTEKQINAKEEKLAKATSPKLKAKLEAEIREIQAKFTRRVHEAKKPLEPIPTKG